MDEKKLNKSYITGIVEASKGNKELLVNEIINLCSNEYKKGLIQGKFDAAMNLQEKDIALIKYLEDKIKETKIGGCDCLTDKMFETEKRVCKDILKKVKSGKYE